MGNGTEVANAKLNLICQTHWVRSCARIIQTRIVQSRSWFSTARMVYIATVREQIYLLNVVEHEPHYIMLTGTVRMPSRVEQRLHTDG